LERKDYAISISLSLLFTAIFSPVGNVFFNPLTIEWWLFQVWDFLALNFVILTLYKALFLPPSEEPAVPETPSPFDNAIIGSKYNFCSTSTKEVALWRSPTFSYYLNLNTIKSISEKATGPKTLRFSSEPADKKRFYLEGKKLLEDYTNKSVENILSKYSGIRILIYPEKVFKRMEKHIEAIISIHALGRVYCIPVVREELLKHLNALERSTLQNLSNIISQKISDEHSFSRWDKVVLKLKKNGPYSCSLPDFLIIDAYAQSLSPETASVWWYEGTTPKSNRSKRIIELAQECFEIIAREIISSWDSVIWDGFDETIFKTVPVITELPLEMGYRFFAKDYYKDWMEQVVPRYPKLKQWIEQEEQTLFKIVDKEKPSRVLDVGCGWGRHMELLLKKGVKLCAGVDKEPIMIIKARQLYKYGNDRVVLKLESAEELSFNNDSFDMVICMTNTFGNIEKERQRRKVIHEIYRVLRKGGCFILSVYQNTTASKRIREKSYIDDGLRPYPVKDDPTVVKVQEGLYSKQFSPEEIENYLSQFRSVQNISVNDVASIFIAYK